MPPDAWNRVEELFQAAQAQPPEKRTQFLARSCSDDPGLRAEVESLLRAADDSFLNGSPFSSIQPAPPGLESGKKLGHFEIIEVLGRGGMGDVYRACDLRLGREVALKTLPPVFAADRDRVKRFEHEARAASALNHPNIVSVFDAGSTDGIFWIASELVDGETLAEVIARGPVASRRLIEIASQIAAGLAAAHGAGIVHRDLKPANLMLSRDGRVKILDFGLAKQKEKTAAADSGSLLPTQSLTTPGMAIGTPGYMSPEQVRGEAADARSDIFSFGTILYEMAAGRRAFTGDSAIAVMHAILMDEPEELPTTVPAMLDRIVRRCLEKEPARRFQTASDLQFALETSGAARVVTVSPPGKRRWRASIVACIIVAAAGAYWLRGYVQAKPPVELSELRQVTFDHGLTADPAISPDGKLLAFASDRAGAGNLDIWVKQIDGGEPVALTNDPANEYDPTFSPDGERIAFTSERDGGGIYIMPALGGEASLLVSRASRPRFSPDGRYLLYLTGVPSQRIGMGSAVSHVFAMPLTGGAPIELSKGCSIVTRTPIWTPDGERALFPALCGGRWDIWAAGVTGKQLQPTLWREYASRVNLEQILQSGGDLQGWLEHPLRLLLHSHEGTADFLLAAPASPKGLAGVGPPERITFGTGAEMQASIAANGRVAIGSLAYEAHIWGLPIDDSGRATGAVRQLTAEFPEEIQPTLSSNGDHLLFLSSKSVPSQLYGKDLTTGRVRRLSQNGGVVKMGAAIDKGGSAVIYLDISSSGASLYSVPFAGGVPQKTAIAVAHAEPSDWARTGRALLLLHSPESAPGHFSIDVADTTNGHVTPLIADSARDLFEAHFSPDARWVTFTVLDNGKSRVFIAPFRWAPIPPAEWRPITGETAWSDKPRFSNDGTSVLFTSDRDGFRCIWAQRLSPDMRPIGDELAVFHSHGSQLSIRNCPLSDCGMSVGKGWLVFDQTEFKGNIWMLEVAAR